MKSIVEILMDRDGETRETAIKRIKETKMAMEECNYDPFECDNIMKDYLGLEPDYIFDILHF